MSYQLVLDVGKTNAKLQLLDTKFEAVFVRETANRVLNAAPYPQFDIAALWQWMLEGVREAARKYHISSIGITTHGAAAALINRSRKGDGLVLPVLDYEYAGVESCSSEYDALRPEFSESYSPALPAGLNLGRQLYWLQRTFPEEFAQVTDILMYPQYWAWRFTGRRCSEVTSLGCHTDLWSPVEGDYSSVVERLAWRRLFPDLIAGWTALGTIDPAISGLTGLPLSCCVFAGVHDSNASFLRYRACYPEEPFTVISTGTWSIVMAAGVPLAQLDSSRDMLANVDVTGQPVACARFMGGREYAAICKRSGVRINERFGQHELQKVIDAGTLAIPAFSGSGGPFSGREGTIEGSVPTGCGAALASLYCALTLDYMLDMLNARGDIFIEGAFVKNNFLCALLAQLRSDRQVRLSPDDTGTIQGCALLASWGRNTNPPVLQDCGETHLKNLGSYKSKWRSALQV